MTYIEIISPEDIAEDIASGIVINDLTGIALTHVTLEDIVETVKGGSCYSRAEMPHRTNDGGYRYYMTGGGVDVWVHRPQGSHAGSHGTAMLLRAVVSDSTNRSAQTLMHTLHAMLGVKIAR